MRANRQTENAATAPQNAAEWYANFLAIEKQFQALEAQNADWNVKKARLKKPRRWRKKRMLVPPAARTSRPRGAQPGNNNRFTHGKRTRQRELLFAMIRTHIRAGRVLTALVQSDPQL